MNEKLEAYRIIKQDLKEIKEEEMRLRVEIVNELVHGKEVGTYSFPDYEGLSVKVQTKLSYKLDKDILESLALSDEELECIKWTPSLVLKEYKANETIILDEAVIVTLAAPTLTVELL